MVGTTVKLTQRRLLTSWGMFLNLPRLGKGGGHGSLSYMAK